MEVRILCNGEENTVLLIVTADIFAHVESPQSKISKNKNLLIKDLE